MPNILGSAQWTIFTTFLKIHYYLFKNESLKSKDKYQLLQKTYKWRFVKYMFPNIMLFVVKLPTVHCSGSNIMSVTLSSWCIYQPISSQLRTVIVFMKVCLKINKIIGTYLLIPLHFYGSVILGCISSLSKMAMQNLIFGQMNQIWW